MAAANVTPKFLCSEADLLQSARLNRDLLNENLAAFTAEDPAIDAAYVTAYSADIEDAEAQPSDEVIEDTLSSKTTAVTAAKAAAAAKVKQLRYYVLQAFPKDKDVQHKFGLDRWDAVRSSDSGAARFLEDAHGIATQYATELTAVGYGSARIAGLLTVHDLLVDADSDQEDYRRSRPKLTSLRRTEFNEVYDRITRINSLAQIVFADDPDKAAQFVFAPGGGDSTDGPGEYPGSIAAGQKKKVAHIAYKAERTLTFQNSGDVVLQFYLTGGGLDPDGGTVVVLTPGSEQSNTMADLSESGSYIIVQDPTDSASNYVVTVGE